MSSLALPARRPLGMSPVGHRVIFGRVVIVAWVLVWMVATGLVLAIDASQALDEGLWLGVGLAVWAGLLFWFLIGAQPRNRVVWVFVLIGALNSVLALSSALVIQATSSRGLPDDPTGIPLDDLGLVGATAIFLDEVISFAALAPVLTLALAWFPDGRDLSRRWSIIPALVVSGLVMDAVAEGWETWPLRAGGVANYSDREPGYHTPTPLSAIEELGALLILVAIILSVASLVIRYRRSGGSVRRQLRWILWGSATAAAVGVPLSLIGGRPADLGVVAVFAIVFTSYTVAIWRHQLFDIDVVISKSITYLGLVAMITAVYVAVVVILPRLALGTESSGLALPLLATALVAVLFEPARQRLAARAERLVYGRRASPLQVLSQLTARLSASSDDETDELARLVADGTGAEQVTVWVQVGEDLAAHGHWSGTGAPRPDSVAHQSLRDDPTSMTRAVRHGDEVLGAITVTKPRTDPVNPGDVDLVAAVAGNAGLLLRNLSLDGQLRERAAEVRASRRRLIAAQDAERHLLERDLHDGAQQHVVALRVKLGIARSMAIGDGNDEVAAAVDELAAATQGAVEAMRAIAHGIYPPLLEAEGLDPALGAIAPPEGVRLRIDADRIGRLTRRVEETIYFCVVELVNVLGDAGGRRLDVAVMEVAGQVELQADVDIDVEGMATTAINDRIDAAGGSFLVTSTERGGRLEIALASEEVAST